MIVNPLELLLKYRVLTFEELSRLSGFSREVLERLVRDHGTALRVEGELVRVVNPIDLALRLVQRGMSPTRVSELISWRDFEEFSAEILSKNSYETVTNLLLTSPVRFQIDVLGVDTVTGMALAVDCKHWSRNTRVALTAAAQRHLERLEKMRKYRGFVAARYPVVKRAVEVAGVILTLVRPLFRVYSGSVVLVSISEFNSFLRDLRAAMDELGVKPLKLY